VAALFERISSRRILAAGALCGIAASFTQSKGAAVVLALLTYLWWKSRQDRVARGLYRSRGLQLCVAAMVVFAAINLPFILAAGLHRWFADVIVFPLRYFGAVSANNWHGMAMEFSEKKGILKWICLPFLYFVVPVSYIWIFVEIWRRRKSDCEKYWDQLFLLALVGGGMLITVAPNYVNPALHSAYAALDSDTRVFKIEDNPSMGVGTAGQFTITKFNGENDFSEARIDLNFKTIKGINSTTTGDFDPSFQKYSGLLGGKGFVPRLAETFGHEANHGIFALQDLTQGTAIQRIINQRDAAMQALPAKGRYPLPPDVLQKMQAADKALVPTERFAQQAEKIVNGELKASQVK
jgi:hypothetical protein